VQVEVHEAKRRLSTLIEAARGGDEIVIAQDGVPLVRLVPVARRPFRIGILSGIVPSGGPDFLEPMSKPERTNWESAGGS
jgi:prevent-host-death family protein